MLYYVVAFLLLDSKEIKYSHSDKTFISASIIMYLFSMFFFLQEMHKMGIYIMGSCHLHLSSLKPPQEISIKVSMYLFTIQM
jgi:hypothetical protein